jgi:hypothetical protein
MRNRIYNIGTFNYFKTIFFGKNRTVKKIVVETKKEDGTSKSEILISDYIVTIGKKAIIVTILGAEGKATSRKPIIVVPWKKTGVDYDKQKNIKMTFYQDVDDYQWMYLQDNIGQAISMYNSKISNKSFHLEFL